MTNHKQNKVSQITGKSSPLKDNIINVVITTINIKQLNLVSDGNNPQTIITENGYT